MLIRAVVFMICFPVSVCVISLSVYGLTRIIKAIYTETYFGAFAMFGQPFDLVLEIAMIVLVSIPIVLPACWLFVNLRKLLNRASWKSKG